MAHISAAVQESITPPSPEALVRAIEAQSCPYCGAGPFKSLGAHTNKAHGVSAADLREAAGVPRVCSEELSEDSRVRLERRPDREGLSSRGGVASIRKQREAGTLLGNPDMTAVLSASLKPRLAVMDERDPRIVARGRSGDRLCDIAADFGIAVKTVREALARAGVKPSLEQTNSDRRSRLESHRAQAAASMRATRLAEREQRATRFRQLGGDWRAVGLLAAELGRTEKAMRAYLRRIGVQLPDGRGATHRRPAERPDMRGRPNRACRAVSDEVMAEVRQVYATGTLSQREVADRFDISQSIVSRIVTGKYVE